MRTSRRLALGVVAAASLSTATAANAHTISICWHDEADGSKTFYARNYHGPQQPTGSLVIDGVKFPFTAAKLGRPPAITACQPVGCDTAAIPNAYLSVNIPNVPATPHTLAVTCTNDLSCGFPGCYPTPVDFTPEGGGCPDQDVDEICDDDDNCASVANDDQTDSDADGPGDACDACPFDAANDADGDGVCGDVDNCTALGNPDQADGDQDGFGDACDPCPLDALDDEDGDGICGDVDACAGTTLPDEVPVLRLGVNRFAIVEADGVFLSTPPPGRGVSKRSYTIDDTAGCSCTQIIAELGLGNGARKFGCPGDAMREWIESVNE